MSKFDHWHYPIGPNPAEDGRSPINPDAYRVRPGWVRVDRFGCLKLAFALRSIPFRMRRMALKQFITG